MEINLFDPLCQQILNLNKTIVKEKINYNKYKQTKIYQ